MLTMRRKNQLSTILKDAGWSIYRLAKESGVGYRQVWSIHGSDEIPPRTHYETLRKIADALDVSIDDLESERK